jgi:hypothetical protein
MPGDGLLTLGICSRNIGAMSIGGGARGTLTIDMAKQDWGGARALGLPITLHTSGPSPIKLLEEAGFLGPDVQLVHPLKMLLIGIAALFLATPHGKAAIQSVTEPKRSVTSDGGAFKQINGLMEQDAGGTSSISVVVGEN